ncbi:hypothetical protein IKO50_06525 [bacterium]|nr:hypothetical protein [bacterium]
MKTKESGSVKVDSPASSEKTLLNKSEKTIAKFSVKPSNSSDDDLTLDEFTISFAGSSITKDDIRVKVDGEPFDPTSVSGGKITFEPFSQV